MYFRNDVVIYKNFFGIILNYFKKKKELLFIESYILFCNRYWLVVC